MPVMLRPARRGAASNSARRRLSASCSRSVTSASIVTAATMANPLKKIFQNSIEPKQREAVRDRRDEDGAEHDAENRARSAEHVHAADHDGGDDVSSKPFAAPESSVGKRDANRKPPSPASAPEIANAVITRRPAGMPAKRAASGFEPIA